MKKYWTSKKSKAKVQARRMELELLIDFANIDTINDENQRLQARTLDHLHQHPALHSENRDMRPEAGRSNSINLLQQHLRSRLDIIIENKQMLWEVPLWQISGSVVFTIDRDGRQFHERFQLRKVKHGKEINALKKVMDLWLIEIIRDLDFSPRRFGQCARCDNYYYSPTIKERIYCSTRCSGAARQEKFRKERRTMDQKTG